jgi:hypothetical protein
MDMLLINLLYIYIYIFGQHMELPRASKIPKNSHINQRKKKEKLSTTAIMKKLD